MPLIHEKTHLPVIVDPSHATGKANLVEPMMIAAVAAGADGLEVDCLLYTSTSTPRSARSSAAACGSRRASWSRTRPSRGCARDVYKRQV